MFEYINPGKGEILWQIDGTVSFAGIGCEDANLTALPYGRQAAGRFVSKR